MLLLFVMTDLKILNNQTIDSICNKPCISHYDWCMATDIKCQIMSDLPGLLISNSSAGLYQRLKYSYLQFISKIVNYALKFSAVLSLKMSEAVNTPYWSYICSFQENRHGFNN